MGKQLNENAEFQQSKTDKMFTNIKGKDGNITICCGGYAVSAKKFKTYEEADKYISKKPYEIIVNLVYIVLQHEKENKENAAKDKKSN